MLSLNDAGWGVMRKGNVADVNEFSGVAAEFS
jgi:hypothetical protein